jgi:hypothetical protein
VPSDVASWAYASGTPKAASRAANARARFMVR